jgi:uncharacterized protein
MEIVNRAVTVRTYKYDGTEHRKWRAQVSRQEDSLLVLDARFEEEIRHPLLGTVAPGTVSIEYYWLDRWYNIFRFVEPTGALRNFYCNVNVPPVLQGDLLSYIDLDMDVLVAPDYSYSILDEDEFAANAARFNYPAEVILKSKRALEELIALIEKRDFPFRDFE